MQILNKIFEDKDGRVVVGQRPNRPIIVAFVFWFASKVLNDPLNKLTYFLFLGFLLWWAILEITQGVNYFRRLLGLLVVIFIIYSFVKMLI